MSMLSLVKVGLDSTIKIGSKLATHFVKNAPAYYTGVGLAGSVATLVMTVKATKKMDELQNKYSETKRLIESNYGKFSEEEVNKDLVEAKADYIVEAAKIIAPVAVVGFITAGSFLMSWNISNKRIKALGSALLYIKEHFDKYRGHVSSEYGEEKEQEIYLASGKEVKEELEVVGYVDQYELHGRWFDESDEFAKDDTSYNRTVIENARKKMDAKLGMRGYILMNELYDALGMGRTKQGAILGWKLGDAFDIYEKLVVTIEGNDEEYTSIYCSWPTPRYVYDEVEFEGRYGAM